MLEHSEEAPNSAWGPGVVTCASYIVDSGNWAQGTHYFYRQAIRYFMNVSLENETRNATLLNDLKGGERREQE